MIKNPLISVIMPVYNSKLYLRDAIDSIIKQTIGFENNIEFIIIDDGSTDDSSKICQEFRNKYPNNIIFIEQKNAGVSSARNRGFSVSRGKYVNFFDSDDMWSKDGLEKSISFLEKNKDKVDFVASKINFFDLIIGGHRNNYKFYRTRVLNIDKEPDSPIYHVITCVFSRKAVEHVKFDDKLRITEDAKFISEVLKKKRAYGVLENSVYYYRKRLNSSSAVDNKKNDKNYYTIVPKLAYLEMMRNWSDKNGKVDFFMQNQIMSDIFYRIKEDKISPVTILNDEQIYQYKKNIRKIISKIDDKIIIKKKQFPAKYKLFLLNMKYGDKGYDNKIVAKDGHFIFNDILLRHDSFYPGILIEFINKTSRDVIKIEGKLTSRPIMRDSLKVEIDGILSDVIWKDEGDYGDDSFMGEPIVPNNRFITYVDMSKAGGVKFCYEIDGKKRFVKIETGKFCPLSQIKMSKVLMGGYILVNRPSKIAIKKSGMINRILVSVCFILGIVCDWRIDILKTKLASLKSRDLTTLKLKARLMELAKPFAFTAEACLTIPRDLFYRFCAYILSPYAKSRPIWIICDRASAAGDNGEALFKYINNRYHKENVFFVISRRSDDYKRLKKIGKTINHGGFVYKLMLLICDKLISSHIDIEIVNPYYRQRNRFADLLTYQFVFLQHGAIRYDLSDWLNRYNQNIGLFVTSTQKEYESILRLPYYYDNSRVVLSGLPRYDLLKSEPKNKLIVAPTYRNGLLKNKTNKLGQRKYDSSFKDSDYCKFYNKFINDKKLLEVLSNNNITLEFYIHPNFEAQKDDFQSFSNLVKIMDFPHDYGKMFREGSVLISDFSSVVFDFAYLKKPVIYNYFDKDFFFASHTYKNANFFSDEKDGFGPVLYNYEDLLAETIKTLSSGCKMTKKYQKRVDTAFKWNDRDNCKRVYTAIRNM